MRTIDMNPARATEFTTLYTEHERRLYRLVASLLPSASDADDVMQETAKKLWQEFDRYRTDDPFLPWACAIARFEVLSFLKRQKAQRQYFSDDVVELLAADWGKRHSAREAQALALEHCVKKLSPHDRRMIHQRYEDGSSMKDLAERLDRTPNAIYKSLQRIRRALFDCVSQRLALEGS